MCFTRDPSSGHSGVYGDYLENAQGEDVVAGIRNTLALSDLERINKPVYDELRAIMRKLETHYRDMCDIEFTIERGKLWMLQTRVGKRTAAAAFRIATQLLGEKLITRDEALGRVTGDQLTQLMFPQFDAKADKDLIARGMAASPGAAVGKIALQQCAGPSKPPAKASRPSSCAARPTLTTCPAWSPPRVSSPRAAVRPRTPPSSLAAWARPACVVPSLSLSMLPPAPSPSVTSS